MESTEPKNFFELVIPQSDEIFYFNHDVYNDSILCSYISRKDFDDILTESEKVVCKSHINKLRFEKQELKIWIYIMIIISIIAFIISLSILFYSPGYRDKKNLDLIAIYLAIFGLFILVVVLFYNIFSSKISGKDINDFIFEGLNNYLESINKKFNKKIVFRYNKRKKEIILSIPNKFTQEKYKKIKFDKRNVYINSQQNLPSSSNLDNLLPKNRISDKFSFENHKMKGD